MCFQILGLLQTEANARCCNREIRILKTLSSKQSRNWNHTNSKPYDLEDRTLEFAKQTTAFVNRLPKTIANVEVGRQLARASSSVVANYIEANGSLGKKDLLMHIEISRKESKESRY